MTLGKHFDHLWKKRMKVGIFRAREALGTAIPGVSVLLESLTVLLKNPAALQES